MNPNPLFTRRKFVAMGAAAGTVAVLTPAFARASIVGPMDRAEQRSVSDYLTVMQASDGRFEGELDRLFPGLRQDPSFSAIQAQSVLVTNVSKRKIRAHSTNWVAATPNGPFQATRLHFFHQMGKHPNYVHFGVKGYPTLFSGKVPLFKPGATRLLTPYFNWSPKYYMTQPAPNWPKLLQVSKSRRKFYENLSAATEINVDIGGIVLSRKHVLGSDGAKLGRVYRRSRNAEHDEASEILKLVQSGTPLDLVSRVLEAHARKATSIKPGSLAEKNIYFAVRKRQAKVLLRKLKQALKRGKPEHFTSDLVYLKQQRRTSTGLNKKSKISKASA